MFSKSHSKLILHIHDKPFQPLEKTSNIELFFDLVLIFCMRNINAALDFVIADEEFFIDSRMYLTLSIALFLLAIMAYTLFNKTRGAVRKRWIAGRLGFGLLVLIAPLFTRSIPYADVVIAVIGVVGVFLSDRFLYFRLLPIKIKSDEKASESETPES